MQLLNPNQPDPDRTVAMPLPLHPDPGPDYGATDYGAFEDDLAVHTPGSRLIGSADRGFDRYDEDPGQRGYSPDGGGPAPGFDGYSADGYGQRSSVLPLVVGLALSAVVGLAAYALFRNTDRIATEGLMVPSVVGQTQSDATDTLIDAGFTVEIDVQDGGATNPTGQPGTVVAQDPAGGTMHAASTPVLLTVAASGETVVVTDVNDYLLEEAMRELGALGLNVAVVEEATDSVVPGRVIRQSIPSGIEAVVGTEITITISSGSDALELPDVTGRSREDAEQVLRNAGLVPQVQYSDLDPTSPDIGYVVAQTPQYGVVIRPGADIMILVGRARDTTSPTTADQATATTTAPTGSTNSTVTPSSQTTSQATSSTEVSGTDAVGPFPDSSQLLTAFSEAWSSGDWQRLSTMADNNAVAVAQEYYEAGYQVLIDPEAVDWLLKSCVTVDDDSTTCEILYGGDEDVAAVFSVVLARTPDGFVVSSMTPAGDAG